MLIFGEGGTLLVGPSLLLYWCWYFAATYFLCIWPAVQLIAASVFCEFLKLSEAQVSGQTVY